MTAYLNALGVICALGRDKLQVARNLFAGDCSGMRSEAGWVPERSIPVAAVRGELAPIPPELARQSSRNNQLLLEAALQIRDDIDRAIHTYGRDRIGVVARARRVSTKPAKAWPITSANSSSRPNMTTDNRSSAHRRTSLRTGCS